MKTAGVIVAGLLVLFVGTFTVASVIKAGAQDRAYQNQLDACERGNVLRQVIYSNTQTAVEENRGSRIGRNFQRNLNQLLATPGVDPDTGAVTCTEVIQAP